MQSRKPLWLNRREILKVGAVGAGGLAIQSLLPRMAVAGPDGAPMIVRRSVPGTFTGEKV